MTRSLPKPATCAVCDQPGAYPVEGHTSPLCREHDQAWLSSAERARAATARDDFVRRARAERERPAPKGSPPDDDPWQS
jgi:hypothetical protein